MPAKEQVQVQGQVQVRQGERCPGRTAAGLPTVTRPLLELADWVSLEQAGAIGTATFTATPAQLCY